MTSHQFQFYESGRVRRLSLSRKIGTSAPLMETIPSFCRQTDNATRRNATKYSFVLRSFHLDVPVSIRFGLIYGQAEFTAEMFHVKQQSEWCWYVREGICPVRGDRESTGGFRDTHNVPVWQGRLFSGSIGAQLCGRVRFPYTSYKLTYTNVPRFLFDFPSILFIWKINAYCTLHLI